MLLCAGLVLVYLFLWWFVVKSQAYPVFMKSLQWKKGPPVYSDAWYADMASWGGYLKKQGVQRVVFVHGTFVGDDPFDYLHLAKMLTPSLSWKWWRYFVKSYHDGLMRDSGNFTKTYVRAFQNSSGITADRLTWCSGNHHMARIRGLLKLVRLLSAYPEQHIVLIGHSHAGQLFALLTQLRVNTKGSYWDLLQSVLTPTQYRKLHARVLRLEKSSFDMITLGMPVRYDFASVENQRIVHFINHRGHFFYPAWGPGLPWALYGDLIQHIGGSGSDGRARTAEDRKKNLWLDTQLGVGLCWKSFFISILKVRKRPQTGKVVLVDYKDRTFFPFSPLTVFGHGSYTRLNRMHFNLSILIRLLYSNEP
ncbi:MAG: hypothetical protein AB8C84_13345 [Oligoflexales bacterium]